MYPLYVDITDRKAGEIHCFDATSGEIICIEGSEKDVQALVVVE